MKYKAIFLFFLLSFLLQTVVFLLPPVAVAQTEQQGAVVVVIIDRININDLVDDQLVGFERLMAEGAVGLVNSRSAGRINPQNNYVTIGAGTHALGVKATHEAFDVHTHLQEGLASEIYYQRTGKTAPESGVVQLGIAALIERNKALPRTVQVGGLGAALNQAGLKTAVFGNADLPGDFNRLAVAIAMNEKGVVDYGLVGNKVLLTDPAFPGGKRTDYQGLLQAVLQSLPEYQLLVVELGDTGRLHQQRHLLFDHIYQQNHRQALQRADAFLTELVDNLTVDDLLIVLSPTPNQLMLAENKRLTPIIIWDQKGSDSERYLLTSGTTKHSGIVKNTDIAPTILAHLNISPSNFMSGRPMYLVGVSFDAAHYLQDKQDDLAITFAARPFLQTGYVFFQIFILSLALGLIFAHKKGAKILQPAILVILAVPLACLLMPLLPQPSLTIAILQLILLPLLITAVVFGWGRGDFFKSFSLLAGATVIVLLIDIILGQPLQKEAIFSYDPMVGARFYGIGNEYMGVLIGATIMFMALMIHNYPKQRQIFIALSGLIFAVTVYCIAAPHLGTNVGGTIAASVAFLVTFFLFTGVKISFKIITMMILMVMAVVFSFIIFDLSRPLQYQSHIGQTARLILDGGLVEIWHIIVRKLEMNLTILQHTVWSKVWLISIIILALLFYYPRGLMKTIQHKYPDIFKGFIGVVVGALVAFVFNDSGVVAAATTMIFVAPPLIYLVLREQSTVNK